MILDRNVKLLPYHFRSFVVASEYALQLRFKQPFWDGSGETSLDVVTVEIDSKDLASSLSIMETANLLAGNEILFRNGASLQILFWQSRDAFGNASLTSTGSAFVKRISTLCLTSIGLNVMTSRVRATVTRSSPKKEVALLDWRRQLNSHTQMQ